MMYHGRCSQILILLSIVAAACAPSYDVSMKEVTKANALNAEYRVAAHDVLEVRVWNQDDLSGTHRVRPDGAITVPLVGDVPVAGLAPRGVARALKHRLEGLVVDPRVTVFVTEPRPLSISVIGEVRQPGEFGLHGYETVLHALARAGGLTEFADEDDIYVIRGSTRFRFSYRRLVRGRGYGSKFLLAPADIVFVDD